MGHECQLKFLLQWKIVHCTQTIMLMGINVWFVYGNEQGHGHMEYTQIFGAKINIENDTGEWLFLCAFDRIVVWRVKLWHE